MGLVESRYKFELPEVKSWDQQEPAPELPTSEFQPDSGVTWQQFALARTGLSQTVTMS